MLALFLSSRVSARARRTTAASVVRLAHRTRRRFALCLDVRRTVSLRQSRRVGLLVALVKSVFKFYARGVDPASNFCSAFIMIVLIFFTCIMCDIAHF